MNPKDIRTGRRYTNAPLNFFPSKGQPEVREILWVSEDWSTLKFRTIKTEQESRARIRNAQYMLVENFARWAVAEVKE